jgi:phage terminase large subunit-like protein
MALLQIRRTAKGKERADKVIRFIELLRIPSGKGQGERFKLDKWQKDFIRDIYEPHTHDGHRAVRRAILSMARKNGKSTLIAGIALAHLVGPEAIVNGEIYSAANDRDQAGIIFKLARQIVEQEPRFKGLIDVVSSTKTMIGRRTASVYRAISAEAGTKHGYLPSVVIYDELAQSKNRNLYDVLDTSFGARDEPLFIAISTQSNDPEHILSQLIDDGLSGADPSIVCHLHAADEDCELDDKEQWKKANPALGSFRNYEDLATAISKAKRMPAEEPKVRNLFLNQRVAPVSVLIARADWEACAGNVEFASGERLYAGLDLSSTNDLTALVLGSDKDPMQVNSIFWKPLQSLVQHSNRDFGSGNHRYVQWKEAGFIETTPGRSIDLEVIARKLAELTERYNIVAVAYDRWRVDDLLREFDRIGLKAYKDNTDKKDDYRGFEHGVGLRLVPWGQGYVDMAPAIDALERAVMDKTIVHSNNPVLNWNISNAIAVLDPAGNRKIDKQKVRFRVDGAVALAMMAGVRARDRANVADVEALIG